MLAQEWTRSHGQCAGLRPARAGLRPVRLEPMLAWDKNGKNIMPPLQAMLAMCSVAYGA